jgi:hypothetical protein
MGMRFVNMKKKSQGPEQRRSPRRLMRYPAKIDPGGGAALRPCIICDISLTGAQLRTEADAGLPEEFVLLLGRAPRRCRVVWRKDRQVGVLFWKEPEQER